MSVLLQHHLGPAQPVPGEEGGLGLGLLRHLGGLGGAGQGQEGVEPGRDLSVVRGRRRREGDPALKGGGDGPEEGGVRAGHVGERRDRGHALWWSTRSGEKNELIRKTAEINCNNYS